MQEAFLAADSAHRAGDTSELILFSVTGKPQEAPVMRDFLITEFTVRRQTCQCL